MKKFLLITAVLLTTVSGAVYAASGNDVQNNQGQNQNFDNLDLNNDGLISLEEMQTRHAENFSRWDTNKDGFISNDEMPRAGNRGGNHRRGNFNGNCDYNDNQSHNNNHRMNNN